MKARYIERCPASEPVISTLIKAESAPRKRGSKMAKKFEAPETIEQRVLEAAVPGEAIRFAVTAYTLGNADREVKSDDFSMVNVGDNSGGIANKVSILWRANFEEFIGNLWHKSKATRDLQLTVRDELKTKKEEPQKDVRDSKKEI